MKKIISVLVSVFILYSFVAVDAIQAFNVPDINTVISNLNINPSIGTISNNYINEKQDKLIVYIQDLHANPSVQKNIAKIIDDLDKNYGVDKILVEGAPYSKLDTSVIDTIKKYNLSNILLNNGLLSGVEYFLANYDKDIPVYGLEDWNMYLKNAQKASYILKEKERNLEVFANFEKKIFSKLVSPNSLMKYVDFDISDYKLVDEIKQPVLKYDMLYNYIQLSNSRKKINENKIVKELNKCLNDLKSILSYQQYKTLAGKFQDSDYYGAYALIELYISKNPKLLSKYTGLVNYFNYYRASKNINKAGFIEQKNYYFEDYLNSLEQDSLKYNEIFILKMTKLFKSFIEINISEQEYVFFKTNYEKYINLIEKFNPEIQPEYDEIFENDEIFAYHDNNLERTKIFFENTLDALKHQNSESKKITVIVSGGFHGSVTKYFRKADISYVTITPGITDYNPYDNTYETILLSSLDWEFANQTLANMLFILINSPVLPKQTRYFFSKQLISNVIKAYSTENPEKIKEILFDIAKKHGIAIEISYDKSAFSIVINNNKNVFKIVNGMVDLESSKYEKPHGLSFTSKLISIAKKFFNVEQSLFMELNPQYKSFISTRTDGNASFTLAQVDNLLKRKESAYKHILDFGDTLLGRGKAVKYKGILIKNFDSKGKEISNEDGTPKIVKKIDVIVEKKLRKYITAEMLQQIFDKIIYERGIDEVSGIKDTIVIGLLEKSQTLFSDQINTGFIGVNRAIFDISDERILKAFMYTGLMHELTHEFIFVKSLEEELLLNDVKYIRDSVAKMLRPEISEEYYTEEFNDEIIQKIIDATSEIFPVKSRFIHKVRNYKCSIEDIASIFNRNDKGYLTEKNSPRFGQWEHAFQKYLKNKPENQEKFFSLLVHEDNSMDMDMMEYLHQENAGIKMEEVNSRLHQILFGVKNEHFSEDENGDSIESLKQIMTSAGIDETIQEEIIDEFKKQIYGCLELLYKKMPKYAFYRYYTDTTAVYEHGLSHCLDVLAYSIKIIGRSGDVNKLMPSSREDEKIDIKELVCSVFMHDLSCVFFRDNHEKNSAVWAKAILKDKDTKNDAIIERIYNNCLGHKKVEMERSPIGCILHDADALSATLNMKRILNIWLNQDNFLMNKKVSINERIEKIKEGFYAYNDGGDGISELLRHYLRSDPAKYKTIGGASIIKTRFDDMYIVRNFLESQRGYIKTKYNKQGKNFTDQDVDEAIAVVDEVLAREFDGYNKPESLPIVIQKESLFVFGIKMKVLRDIIKYKVSKQDMYFNRNIVFSDIHGGYTRFLELMYQMLAFKRDIQIVEYFKLLHNGKYKNGDEIPEAEIRRMQEKIETDILKMWNMKGNKSTLYILGDILDRGPKQIETFMFIKKLSESGRVKYVIGNHDLFALINLFGMHLPITEKFKGIPRDYIIPAGYIGKSVVNVYDEWYDKVSSIRDISRSRDAAYWLGIFSQRTSYSKDRQKSVWNYKLTEISDIFKNSFGFSDELTMKEILSDTENSSLGLDENKELLEFSKAFFGIKFDIEISTGMRDVEQMAVNWWIDKLKEAVDLKAKYPGHDEYWDKVIQIIEIIIKEQKQKYKQEIADGNWGWAVVDAMMYRTYESMEWYSYDYIKHKGWGEALLSQINSYLIFKKSAELNKKLSEKFIKFVIDPTITKMEIANIIEQMKQLGMPRLYVNYLSTKLKMINKSPNKDEIDKIIKEINSKIARYSKFKDSEKAIQKKELCDLILQLDSLQVQQGMIEGMLKEVLELPDFEREGRQKQIDESVKKIIFEISNYSYYDQKRRMISEMEINGIMEKLRELKVSESLLIYLSQKINLVLFKCDKEIAFIYESIKEYTLLPESEKNSAKERMWNMLLELERMRVPSDIIETLSVSIMALPLTESERTQKAGINMINDVNYFSNDEMRSIINFFKNNFALYRVDEYGFYYMHAPLPYDEYGDVAIGRINKDGRFEDLDKNGKRIKGFYYKGVHYTGKKIWDGFSEMAKDIREYDIDKGDQSTIFEALALINAIYADNTTKMKPEYIAKNNINFSMKKMNEVIGIRTVIQGHNPKEKLAKNGITAFVFDQEGRPVSIFVDGNMSPSYAPPRGAGSYVEISPQGIFSIGFPSGLATVSIGLEDKINEDDVIKTISSNIVSSFRVLKIIADIIARIKNSIKKLKQKFDTSKIKITNTTMFKIVNKITDDKDIIERLNYSGINCIGIALKNDFRRNILDMIYPVVRESSVNEKHIETFKINSVEVEVYFVTVKVGDNTLKILTVDYDETKISYGQVVQRILIHATGKTNNKYLKHIGVRKNMLSVGADSEFWLRYESVPLSSESEIFDAVISKSFKIKPVIFDIRKENTIGEFIGNFDKNLSFDIIQTMLSAA